MKVIDMHCDTIGGLFHLKEGGKPMPCPLRLRHAPDIVTAQSETELQL